ncbi:MAG: hypothetical protein PWQ27_1352 [Kosmotoga sp.]|nr:hypothetical protein [Kosmotoga sp.]
MMKMAVLTLLFFAMISTGVGSMPIHYTTEHLEFLRDSFIVEGKTVYGYWVYSDLLPQGNYRHVEASGEGATCVDDVARIAIFYLREYEHSKDKHLENRAREALDFLLELQDHDGDFYNFVYKDGKINKSGPTSKKGGNWWAARAFWALSTGASVFKSVDSDYAEYLSECAKKTLRVLEGELKKGLLHGYTDMSSIMILGIYELYKYDNDQKLVSLIDCIANAILNKVKNPAWEVFGVIDEGKEIFDWHSWGSRQVEALADAYEVTGNEEYLKVAEESISKLAPFIISSGPVYLISKNIKVFPQIAYGIEAFANSALRVYEITGNEKYAYYTVLVASWFAGLNHLKVKMIGPHGEGYDGLEYTHRNLNAGAESTVSALLTLQALNKLPEKIADIYNHQKELLTPGIVLEAEKLSLGLSDAEVLKHPGSSWDGAVRCKGLSALRGEELLMPLTYEAFVSILENRTETLTLSLRVGKSKIEKDVSKKTGIQKIGDITGSNKLEKLTLGVYPDGGTVIIDQLILIPKLVVVYDLTLNKSIVLNRSPEPLQGIKPFSVAMFEGEFIKISGRLHESKGISIKCVDKGAYSLLKLDILFENDGIVKYSNRRSGNFDNLTGIHGASYPYEEVKKLPVENGILTVNDIPFLLKTDSFDNFRCSGQILNVELYAEKLHFLGASEHGDFKGEVTITYDDGSTFTIPLAFSDWCGTPKYGEKGLSFLYRYEASGLKENIKCSLYIQSYVIKPGKITTIQFPDIKTMHIFAITAEK